MSSYYAARAVKCPTCKAEKNKPCTYLHQYAVPQEMQTMHGTRYEAAGVVMNDDDWW